MHCPSSIFPALVLAALVSACVWGENIALAQESAAAKSEPTPQERIASLKKALIENNSRLRAYEWVETSIVSKDGEEKARKQAKCYYGAEGNLQKTPIGDAAPKKSPRGIRGRIAKNKREDIAEYMEAAIEQIHKYVPPSPDLIQRAMDSGKMSLHMVEPGKKIKVEFRDFVVSGDSLALVLDVPTNSLLGVNVSTYIEEPEEKVNLKVRFGSLPDGTLYPSETTLEAEAEKIIVVTRNEGYRLLPK